MEEQILGPLAQIFRPRAVLRLGVVVMREGEKLPVPPNGELGLAGSVGLPSSCVFATLANFETASFTCAAKAMEMVSAVVEASPWTCLLLPLAVRREESSPGVGDPVK